MAVSAFALFAAFSGMGRADEGKAAPAPTTAKTTKKTTKAADGTTATTETKTETKKDAAPAKKSSCSFGRPKGRLFSQSRRGFVLGFGRDTMKIRTKLILLLLSTAALIVTMALVSTRSCAFSWTRNRVLDRSCARRRRTPRRPSPTSRPRRCAVEHRLDDDDDQRAAQGCRAARHPGRRTNLRAGAGLRRRGDDHDRSVGAGLVDTKEPSTKVLQQGTGREERRRSVGTRRAARYCDHGEQYAAAGRAHRSSPCGARRIVRESARFRWPASRGARHAAAHEHR